MNIMVKFFEKTKDFMTINFKKIPVIILEIFNIISVGILLINNYPKQLSNCFLHNFSSYTIDSDISYVGMFLPMFNSKNYVIDKAIVDPKPVIEDVKAEEEYKFSGDVVNAFAGGVNNNSEVSITYTSDYQKVRLYGITVYNSSSKTNLDYPSFINKDIKLSRKDNKILLYCTHTSESYVNSDNYKFEYSGTMRTRDARYNMLSVASVLKDSLIKKDFNVILDTTPHDYASYDSAYENSYETIQKQLNGNENFSLIIDVHRDAYGDLYDSPTVNINGVEVAKIMVVIGVGSSSYENPYWERNLALGMQITKKGEEMYPGLFRQVLVRGSRYNQHLHNGSILIEVGATGNTLDEVYYAATCFSNILDQIYE